MIFLPRPVWQPLLTLAALSLVALCGAATPGRLPPQVVVGAGTRWVELLPPPEQWEFVRANADGFYANFIGMDHCPQVKFNDLAKIMPHKVAFLESDMRDATAAADQRSRPSSSGRVGT